MESVAEQITKTGFSIGGARLKNDDEETFKEHLKRFVGDQLNYWNA